MSSSRRLRELLGARREQVGRGDDLGIVEGGSGGDRGHDDQLLV